MENANNTQALLTIPMSEEETQHQEEIKKINDQILSLITVTGGFEGRLPGLRKDTELLRKYDTIFVTTLREKLQTWGIANAERNTQDLIRVELEKFSVLIESMTELLSQFHASITSFKSLVQSIVNLHLRAWKRQQRALLDVPNDPKIPKKPGNANAPPGPKTKKLQELRDRLDQIQVWFLAMVDILLDSKDFLAAVGEANQALGGVRRVQVPGHSLALKLNELTLKLGGIEDILRSESLQVETHPDQVTMKTDQKGVLSARIRLLSGLKLHTGGIGTGKAFVTVSLISEEVVQGSSSPPRKTDIVMSNNTQQLESPKWTADFKKVNFQSVNQVRPLSTYHLEATLRLSKAAPVQNVRALSVLIVLVVHQSQKALAGAIIFGKNSLVKDRDSVLSQVPKSIPWSDLGQALSNFVEVRTGRGLSPAHVDYLRAQFFGKFPDNSGSGKVEWEKFYNTDIPGRKWSLWEWFYTVVKFIEDHLLPLWQQGLIEGFISKDMAADFLVQRNQHTFILRFAESMTTKCQAAANCVWKAGISIVWHGYNDKSKKYGIHHLTAFTPAELEAKPLSDQVLAFTAAHFLYPDVPKEDCFRKTVQVAPSSDMTGQNITGSGYIVRDDTISPHFQGQPGTGDNEPGPSVVASTSTPVLVPNGTNPAPAGVSTASALSPPPATRPQAPILGSEQTCTSMNGTEETESSDSRDYGMTEHNYYYSNHGSMVGSTASSSSGGSNGGSPPGSAEAPWMYLATPVMYPPGSHSPPSKTSCGSSFLLEQSQGGGSSPEATAPYYYTGQQPRSNEPVVRGSSGYSPPQPFQEASLRPRTTVPLPNFSAVFGQGGGSSPSAFAPSSVYPSIQSYSPGMVVDGYNGSFSSQGFRNLEYCGGLDFLDVIVNRL